MFNSSRNAELDYQMTTSNQQQADLKQKKSPVKVQVAVRPALHNNSQTKAAFAAPASDSSMKGITQTNSEAQIAIQVPSLHKIQASQPPSLFASDVVKKPHGLIDTGALASDSLHLRSQGSGAGETSTNWTSLKSRGAASRGSPDKYDRKGTVNTHKAFSQLDQGDALDPLDEKDELAMVLLAESEFNAQKETGAKQNYRISDGALGSNCVAPPETVQELGLSKFEEPRLGGQMSHGPKLSQHSSRSKDFSLFYEKLGSQPPYNVKQNKEKKARPDEPEPPLTLSKSKFRPGPAQINIERLDNQEPGAQKKQLTSLDQFLRDSGDTSFESQSLKSSRTKNDVMTIEEMLAVAQPLRGPGFNPDEHIEDWSDDSSDDCNSSFRERTDDEILDELMMSSAPMSRAGGGGGNGGGLPLRRTVAAIYMPIRVNCLYG